MKYTTYIFDLDGTLLDTIHDLAASANYALSVYNMPEHTVEEIRSFVGNGVRQLMIQAVPGGTDHPLFEEVLATFRYHYMEHSLDTTRPYEGIKETLAALKTRGCRLAVVSNKMMAATQSLCRHFFPDLIEIAVGEDEAAGIRKKPAPDLVDTALQQLGLGPDNAVYIGDSEVDIMTAKNAGLPCISVLWGFREHNFLLQHGAEECISSPKELLKM